MMASTTPSQSCTITAHQLPTVVLVACGPVLVASMAKSCVQEKERRVETSSCIEDESRKKRVQSNVYSLLYSSSVCICDDRRNGEEERREQTSRVYKKVLEPVRTTLGYGQTAVAVRIARADDKKLCSLRRSVQKFRFCLQSCFLSTKVFFIITSNF